MDELRQQLIEIELKIEQAETEAERVALRKQALMIILKLFKLEMNKSGDK